MRLRAMALLAGTTLLSLAQPAQAVLVDGGSIQANATDTTVDLFYFNLSQAGAFTPGFAELYGNPPPVSHIAVKLYSNGGPAAGTLVAAANASTPGTVTLNAMLAAGNYIMAVSEFALAAGNFGPLNPDAVNKIGYTYEFGIGNGQDQYVSTLCDYAGNLDGTFSLTVNGGSCGPQPLLPILQPVPEPCSLGLVAAGLVGLAAARNRRRGPGRPASASR